MSVAPYFHLFALWLCHMSVSLWFLFYFFPRVDALLDGVKLGIDVEEMWEGENDRKMETETFG